MAALTLGAVAVNSLAPDHFTNPDCTAFQQKYWTPVDTKYLKADAAGNCIIRLSADHQTRDAEITTWSRNGIMYLRLNADGKAFYFLHNGETTNGTAEIGIVTGLDESTYPGGKSYALWRTTNCIADLPGYNKSDTTGAAFTFGASGFDIYMKFCGTEVCRFKEYRHMDAGAVAIKAVTGYGFRGISWTSFADAKLLSDYANNKLDLRDWNVCAIQTTGTISAGSNSLALAANVGFENGDWVIIELGKEPGVGMRGTAGVGGQWPTLTFADAAAMNADTGRAVNTFAWIRNDGLVYQWNGTAWSSSYAGKTYYCTKAIPYALHGRITAISSDGLTLTLDNAATVAVSNANVYLDNQPYINYLTGRQESAPGLLANLKPITPTDMTVIIPVGNHAVSGDIIIQANDGWILTGVSQQSSVLLSPKGVYSAQINVRPPANRCVVKDLTLIGNWAENQYGLMRAGWTKIAGGLTLAGLPVGGEDTDSSPRFIPDVGTIPGGNMYPCGIIFGSVTGGIAQDCTINEVSQKAVGSSYATDMWVYRCTNRQTQPFQCYIQWMFQFADGVRGGCEDCVVDSDYMIAGFECFRMDDHQFIRPRGRNAGMASNTSNRFLYKDAELHIEGMSQSPSWSKNNPLLNITTNIGQHDVSGGGRVENLKITIDAGINADNDIPVGVIVNAANPNITITGVDYSAPDYMAPSTLYGPQGIISTGPNTKVENCHCCGKLDPKITPGVHCANIGVQDGSVTNCTADVIVAPVQSGNVPCGR